MGAGSAHVTDPPFTGRGPTGGKVSSPAETRDVSAMRSETLVMVLGNGRCTLRPTVSNRKEDRRADSPCTPIRDPTPLQISDQFRALQISDQFRADTRRITFEIGYHHLRRGTETSDSGFRIKSAVPEPVTIVSRNVAILTCADDDNLLRSCWQLFEKSC